MTLSFPKIWHLGVPQVERLYLGDIEITEKLDTMEEVKADFLEKLWKHYWKDLSKATCRGFPEWYKEQLVQGTFNHLIEREKVAA